MPNNGLMSEQEWEEWLTWRKSVDAAVDRLQGGQKRMSDKIEENTRLTLQTKESIDALSNNLGAFPAFMQEGQQTFKFVKRLANLAKILLVFFVAPALALIILTGHSPHWVRELWHLIMEFNK